MRNVAIAACLMLASLLATRASWGADAIPDDPIEYRGCIRWGFEEAFFIPLPNDPNEKWWIVAVPPDFRAMASGIPVEGNGRIMFARVYATLGPRGRYGHLGMASREVAIGAIVELREFEESDGSCHTSTPPPPVPPPEANNRLRDAYPSARPCHERYIKRCFVTNRVLVDGQRVGYLYREEPDEERDSGWRLTANDESEEYMSNADNLAYVSLGAVLNKDASFRDLLDSPVGAAFFRDPRTEALLKMQANNTIEFAPAGRPTRGREAPLLATYPQS